MRDGRLTVLAPLRLRSAGRIGRRLRIVVHDELRRRHVLHVRVANSRTARSHLSVMAEWKARRVSLAYVQGREAGALVDVDALLARAR